MGGSQKRAIQNYRSRLGQRGLARFEVLGRDTDCDLIRLVARRLSEDTPEASALRATHSFGFRPKRSAHQAVARAQELIASGHNIVVDIDLEKFFDRVP